MLVRAALCGLRVPAKLAKLGFHGANGRAAPSSISTWWVPRTVYGPGTCPAPHCNGGSGGQVGTGRSPSGTSEEAGSGGMVGSGRSWEFGVGTQILSSSPFLRAAPLLSIILRYFHLRPFLIPKFQDLENSTDGIGKGGRRRPSENYAFPSSHELLSQY